jgi:hypothetical protein
MLASTSLCTLDPHLPQNAKFFGSELLDNGTSWLVNGNGGEVVSLLKGYTHSQINRTILLAVLSVSLITTFQLSPVYFLLFSFDHVLPSFPEIQGYFT